MLILHPKEALSRMTSAFFEHTGDFIEYAVENHMEKTGQETPLLDGEPEPGKWYRIPLENGLSGDGSGYHIYLKKGTLPYLCLFLSGGGMAWNAYSASRPVTGGRIAAGVPNFYWNNLRPFTQVMNIHFGITEAGNPRNPFSQWNFIVITYATGDFHLGNGSLRYSSEEGQTKTLHFHGYRNFCAAMEKARSFFPHPERLLIAGDSAGAFAVPALASEIMESYYPECRDVTLFSDSALLERSDWVSIIKDVWEAKESIWKPLHTENPAADWYESLLATKPEGIRLLYASSTHDYLLSMFQNEFLSSQFVTDARIQEYYFQRLSAMLSRLSDIGVPFGYFLYNWKNPLFTHGGTVHTAVRYPYFYFRRKGSVSMAEWLHDAVFGNVYNVGEEYREAAVHGMNGQMAHN